MAGRTGRMGPGTGTHCEVSRCRGCGDLHAGRRERPAACRCCSRSRRRRPSCLPTTAALAERIGSVVSGLLTLLGRDADPLQSREHILLSNLLENSWRAGRAVDLAALVASVQKPRDRETRRARPGNVLSRQGTDGARARDQQPAGLAALCRLDAGRTARRAAAAVHAGRQAAHRHHLHRASVRCRAHVRRHAAAERGDRLDAAAARHLVAARHPLHGRDLRLLPADGEATLEAADADAAEAGARLRCGRACWPRRIPSIWITRAWATRAPGSSAGCRPSAIAIACSTDSPRRSRASGPDRASELARLMGSLTQRVFLMRNVHDDAPVLLKSRWALSYLRGPLTPAEIGRLMAPRKAAAAKPALSANGVLPLNATPEAAAAAAAPMTAGASRHCPRNSTNASCRCGRRRSHHLPAAGHRRGEAALRRQDLGLDEWQQNRCLRRRFPMMARICVWDEGEPCDSTTLTRDPVSGATFADLPAGALRAASYAQWGKDLATRCTRAEAQLWSCDALKLTSKPGESEGEFRSRLALTMREQRDDEGRCAAPEVRAEARHAAGPDSSARRNEPSVNAARHRSRSCRPRSPWARPSSVHCWAARRSRRATSAAPRPPRAPPRASGASPRKCERALENVGKLEQRLADLDKECEAAVEELGAAFDPQTVVLREAAVAPRKSDIAVGRIRLLWSPWRSGADGFPVRAS